MKEKKRERERERERECVCVCVCVCVSDRKLKCPFCERLYGFKSNLRAHVRNRHQVSPDAALLANVHQEQHHQMAGTQDRDEPESLP
ncbi:hypothetical protein P5V15_015870 [Pogonomyrmex californicus]